MRPSWKCTNGVFIFFSAGTKGSTHFNGHVRQWLRYWQISHCGTLAWWTAKWNYQPSHTQIVERWKTSTKVMKRVHVHWNCIREANCNRIYVVIRISSLDPAFPQFYPAVGVRPVNKHDAQFVDVIHTDAFFYGAPVSTGTVDFWPNGGRTLQPGCPRRNYKFLSDNGMSNEFNLFVRCIYVLSSVWIPKKYGLNV